MWRWNLSLNTPRNITVYAFHEIVWHYYFSSSERHLSQQIMHIYPHIKLLILHPVKCHGDYVYVLRCGSINCFYLYQSADLHLKDKHRWWFDLLNDMWLFLYFLRKCTGSASVYSLLNFSFSWIHLWCDQAKLVWTHYYWYLDRDNNIFQFPLYLIVLSITKVAVSLDPYAEFWWGFQQNIALTLIHLLTMKTYFFIFFEFRLILPDRITFCSWTNVNWHW